MTDQKKFKDKVRERQQRTGESYTTAKRNLEAELRAAGTTAPEAQAASTTPGPGVAPIATDPPDRHRAERKRWRDRCLGQWRELVDELASGRDAVEWSLAPDVTHVLNLIASMAPLNHVLFPHGGGLDLKEVERSHEPGCIELRTDGNPIIVRPGHLRLVTPPNDPLREWSYFWLETRELAPSGTYEELGDANYEEILELSPREYVDRSFWDFGYYGHDEEGCTVPLPDRARTITRSFRGTFAIVPKASGLNATIPYDGSHSKAGPRVFQSVVEKIVSGLHDRGLYGADPRG